jgi:hypothetical protein
MVNLIRYFLLSVPTVLWLLCATPAFAMGGVTPTSIIPIPIQASEEGFNTLAENQDSTTGFDFDCSGTGTSSLWHNGLWQGYVAPCNQITWNASGYVDLHWNAVNATTGCTLSVVGGCPEPTISSANTAAQGRGFGHGYYEWRMAVSPLAPAAWPAGWILGLTGGQLCIAAGFNGGNTVALPGPIYSEIDTVELFGYADTNVHQTYHYGPNDPNCGATGGPNQHGVTPSSGGADFAQIHKYGLLWCGASSSGTFCNGTPQICWSFDDAWEGCFNTIAATETQLHEINAWMAETCGGSSGTNAPGCLGGATDFHNKVYSIRHWSCATWQTNALGC